MRDNGGAIAIGHLGRREQRPHRLLVRRRRATIPISPARRPLIDGVFLALDKVFREGTNVLLIAERRRRPDPGHVPVNSAKLNGRGIRRTPTVSWTVATCTRETARGRQCAIKKQRSAERGER